MSANGCQNRVSVLMRLTVARAAAPGDRVRQSRAARVRRSCLVPGASSDRRRSSGRPSRDADAAVVSQAPARRRAGAQRQPGAAARLAGQPARRGAQAPASRGEARRACRPPAAAVTRPTAADRDLDGACARITAQAAGDRARCEQRGCVEAQHWARAAAAERDGVRGRAGGSDEADRPERRPDVAARSVRVPVPAAAGSTGARRVRHLRRDGTGDRYLQRPRAVVVAVDACWVALPPGHPPRRLDRAHAAADRRGCPWPVPGSVSGLGRYCPSEPAPEKPPPPR